MTRRRSSDPTPPPGRGRPRGARSSTPPSRCSPEVGYDRLTMDAVAQRAKASKATLYRRWNGKASLVIDALHQAQQPTPRRSRRHRQPARATCMTAFCGDRRPHRQGTEVDAFGAILTAITRDAEFAEAFRTRGARPKLAGSTALFERAKDRGEIRADVDIDLLAPALAGIVLHRFFVRRRAARPRRSSSNVIDQIILPAVRPQACEPSPSHRPQRVTPVTDSSCELTDAIEAASPTSPRATGKRHLGWALVLISVAQLMVVLDAHHRQHRPALHRRATSTSSARRPHAGSSPATRWPSAACCCSAAASVTSTAAAGSS